MYIIELITKLIKNKNQKDVQKSPMPPEIDYHDQQCNHTFLPVDSTGQTLACTKCGLIVKNDPSKIKPKNPFS